MGDYQRAFLAAKQCVDPLESLRAVWDDGPSDDGVERLNDLHHDLRRLAGELRVALEFTLPGLAEVTPDAKTVCGVSGVTWHGAVLAMVDDVLAGLWAVEHDGRFTPRDWPALGVVLRSVDDAELDKAVLEAKSEALRAEGNAARDEKNRAAQPPAETPTAPTTRRERRAKWLAEAMLLVRDHPDWSDAEIARRVGKVPSTLARSTEYRAAAAMARGSKQDLPKGHVNIDEDGLRDVEAYSGDDPAEMDWDG